MEQICSWQATSSSATQEIPRILWNRRCITTFTCPYPEPDQSSPFLPTPRSWRSIL